MSLQQFNKILLMHYNAQIVTGNGNICVNYYLQ